jgi:hypothetical protein
VSGKGRCPFEYDPCPSDRYLNLEGLVKVTLCDGVVKSPSSRRANLVSRGVLLVRRSDSEMKRNAEIGLLTTPSALKPGISK